MKGIVRTLSFALAFSMMFLSFSGFSAANEETNKLTIVRDEKILSAASIDQDFDDSSVMVIMDNVTGGINKQHDRYSNPRP